MQKIPGSPHELPEPDSASAEHSQRVKAHIDGAILKAGGSISFAEFMQLALYAPGLGYYSAGATKLGADGDFVTAPEISPLFGRVIARQCAHVFAQLGDAMILEPGAGSGALAISILGKLEQLDALPDRYLILEVSADFRERQEARLRRECPRFLSRVEWVSRLPGRFSGVIVANEVADAIPVERFRIENGNVLQARVASTDGKFSWQFSSAPQNLCAAVREIEAEIGESFDDGFESEVSPGLVNWIGDLADSLDAGALLLLDYGVTRREYYSRERRHGWLRCHYRHRAHNDPLILPGIQDLTSWVDFSAAAAAGSKAGLTVAGFVSQAHLMINGGLEDELTDFDTLSAAQQIELSGQVKLLTLPAEMGENFKCLGLCSTNISPPPALLAMDRAHLL